MPDVLSGIEIEGQSAGDASDINTDRGFNAALAAKVSAGSDEPEAAPAEQRHAPATPDLDRAAAIRAAALEGEGGPISVQDGLTTHEPGEKAERREEAERIARARQAAADDPDVAALSEQETRFATEAEELAAYRRAEAVDEHLATLEESDELQERAEAWAALTPAEQREALELGYVAEEDASELGVVHKLMAMALDQQKAQADALTAAYEDVEARTNALDAWATERGLEGAQIEQRVREVSDFIAASGVSIGGLPAGEWAELWNTADKALAEQQRAEREANFKNDMLRQSTSIGDGLEVFDGGKWSRMNDVEIQPKPDWNRVESEPQRRETAAEIVASVKEESPLAAEYQRVQRIAEKQAAEAAPKPVRSI